MANSLEVAKDYESDWDITLISYGPDSKPLYDTGWQPRTLNVGEHKIQSHETNNLINNIVQAKALREELKVNPTAPILGRTYDFYFKNGALHIFNDFEDECPELHARIIDINRRILETGMSGSLDLFTERDIHCSFAFEAIAVIATSKKPDLSLNSLTV